MQRLLQLAVILSGVCSVSAGQTLCSADTAACVGTEAASYKSVFEQLKGRADGLNQHFELSGIPDPAFPLHMFRNGIEISSASFTVQGNLVTIPPQAVSTANDSYQAAYVRRVSSEAAPVSRTSTLNKTKEASPILSEYLRRSLRSELNISSLEAMSQGEPSRNVRRQSQERRAFGVSPSPSLDATEPEAITMLSRALRREDKQLNRPNTGKKKVRSQVAPEGGLEGIGDELTASPFDLLSSESVPDVAAIQQVSAEGARTVKLPRTKTATPASLRMLARQLEKE